MTEKFLRDMLDHISKVQEDVDVMLKADINKETRELLQCMRSDMIGLEDRIESELH